MRHPRTMAEAIRPLAIAVVKPAFGALLMPVAGGPETSDAACSATWETAVGVAAIAGIAQEEHLVAEAAGPYPESLHGPLDPEPSGRYWRNRPARSPRAWGGGVSFSIA